MPSMDTQQMTGFWKTFEKCCTEMSQVRRGLWNDLEVVEWKKIYSIKYRFCSEKWNLMPPPLPVARSWGLCLDKACLPQYKLPTQSHQVLSSPELCFVCFTSFFNLKGSKFLTSHIDFLAPFGRKSKVLAALSPLMSKEENLTVQCQGLQHQHDPGTQKYKGLGSLG